MPLVKNSETMHLLVTGSTGSGKTNLIHNLMPQVERKSQPAIVVDQTGEMIAKYYNKERGDIIFNGKPVHFSGPLDAREEGIETVFQTLALADDLDVPDNLFLGREITKWNFLGPFRLLDYRAMREATIEGLERTAVKIPNIRNAIRNMSGGQRQCVAIARTATFHSKLTIMDEPTAALGVQETAQVENIVRTLKEAGEPLILVSHNMRQVFELVDRVVVFRRGRICANLDIKNEKVSGEDVVAYITGAKTQEGYEDAA